MSIFCQGCCAQAAKSDATALRASPIALATREVSSRCPAQGLGFLGVLGF